MFSWIFTSRTKGDEDEGRVGDVDWSPTTVELCTWSCKEWATGGATVVVGSGDVADEIDADDNWLHKRCFLASSKSLLYQKIFN